MPAELAEKAPAGGQQQVDVEEVYTGLRAQDLQEAKEDPVAYNRSGGRGGRKGDVRCMHISAMFG